VDGSNLGYWVAGCVMKGSTPTTRYCSKKREIKEGMAILRSYEMKEDMREQMRLRRDGSSI
jgi:hypothetical protein